MGEANLTFSEFQLACSEVANIVNMRPLGVLPNADNDVLEPLTPNHLLLGRSGREVPIADEDQQASLPVRYRYVQRLTEDWWQRWTELVYPTLVPSYRWLQRHRSVKVGDVCLMKYAKMAKGSYRLCRVEEVKESKSDGLVRRAIVTYKQRENSLPILRAGSEAPSYSQGSGRPFLGGNQLFNMWGKYFILYKYIQTNLI